MCIMTRTSNSVTHLLIQAVFGPLQLVIVREHHSSDNQRELPPSYQIDDNHSFPEPGTIFYFFCSYLPTFKCHCSEIQ